MSTDKLKHAAEELSGQTKETVGKLTGNENMEESGTAEKDKAKLKKVGDSAKDLVDKGKDALS